MWFVFRRENNGNKSFEGWILLANFEDRLLKFCEEMPPMPKTWKSNTLVGRRVASNGFHYWALSHGSRAKKISASNNWLFHEMGWGWTTGKHHSLCHPKVLLEEHHYMFWNSKYVGHKQWPIVHRLKAQQVLEFSWDQALGNVGGAPSGQWTSQGS